MKMITKRLFGFTLVFSFLLALIIAQKPLTAAPTLPSSAWQTLPGPTGGSLTDVILSPDYGQDRTLFVATHGRGVYRSSNDAFAWSPTGLADGEVVDLAISPDFANDHTLFALSGLWTTGYTVQRSSDGGASWQTSSSPASFAAGLSLVVSPNFAVDQMVYLLTAVDNHTYVSTDGGDTFAQAGGWLAAHDVNALAFSPNFAADQTLFALVPNEGLYKSVDGGAVWQPTGLNGSLSALAVSPDFANDHLLIVITAAGETKISTDGGATWNALVGPTLTASGDYSIAFSPTFATDQAVMVASVADPGPYRSQNGGASWESAGWYNPAMTFQDGLLGGGVQALALAPNQGWDGVVFAATRAGLARSPYGGDSWMQMNDGLPQLAVRAFALSPNDPQVMLAGTGYFEQLRFDSGVIVDDAGNIQLSNDGGANWRQVSGRLARLNSVAFSPNFAADQTAFAVAGMIGQHGFVEGGIYRSTDGGANWTAVHPTAYAFTALAISPNYAADHTVWAAAMSYTQAIGVYSSTDGGATWTLVAPGRNVQRLVVSPNYVRDQTLFAGMGDDGVHRSTDGGVTWNRVLETPYVTALAISPVYGASRTVYAAARPNTSAATAVYRSTNGGSTWQQVATGIPAEQNGQPLTVSSLAFAVDGSVLAGVGYGAAGATAVYRSTNGGTAWQMVDGGVPGTAVNALASTPAHSLDVFAAGDAGIHSLTIPQGSLAEPGAWQSSGPRGGKANALAVSPAFANDGVAFSGEWFTSFQITESGRGVFKSTDFGQTWAASSAGMETIDYASALHDVAFSPEFATDQTVFAATGGGLFRSADGGATWTLVDGLTGAFINMVYDVAVAPDFGSSGHMMALGGGLSVSQDGGQTWDVVAQSIGLPTYSPNFAADQTVFGGGNGGVYKSVDQGLTWTGVFSTSVTALAVSPDFAADHTLWAGGAAIYLSDDCGEEWITRTVGTGVTAVYALAVSPDFASDHTLFAGTNNGLYWSADGGMNWTAVPEYAGQSILTLAMSPQWPGQPVLLVGTRAGVYRLLSADPASGVVKQPSQGLAVLRTPKLALSADESVMLAGTVDHGVYLSGDVGQNWQPTGLQAGDTYYGITALAISPDVATDHTLFAVNDNSLSIGASLYRSEDGGATWQFVYSSDNIPSLAISPDFASDGTIFGVGNNGRVQRSTDGGDVWNQLPNWPTDSSRATRLALPPNYPGDGRLFVGSDNGFWSTPDGGATWAKALTGLNGNQYIVEMAVSPNFAADHTLLAAASWSNPPDYTQHYALFRSTDGGVNWQQAMAGLPEEGIGGVAFSPNFAADHLAYVVTGQDLYRSRDGGMSWSLVGAPPGSPWLRDVLVDQAGRVHVGTDAGVWRYNTFAFDVIINGGFEGAGGWELPMTPVTGQYSEQVVYDGRRAMQVGLDNEANVYGYSSARQVVTIPATGSGATLSFYLYPASGEATAVSQAALFPENRFATADQPAQPASGDAQYVLLLDPATQVLRQTLYWDVSNAQAWQRYQVNLSAYRGQSLMLLFGAYNDGANGRTALYVDDVSLIVYDTSSAPYRVSLPIIMR